MSVLRWSRRNRRLVFVVALWGSALLFLALAVARRDPERGLAYEGISARHDDMIAAVQGSLTAIADFLAGGFRCPLPA